MCGIVGAITIGQVNQTLYDAMLLLQHRGQDAAGIVTCENNRLHLRKDNGLVRDVFHTSHMLQLRGNMGLGHVRYPTAGCSSSAEAQPFYVNSPYGISLVHNGNLINASVLKKELFRDDLRHINTDSDSEVLLNIFAHELQRLGKFEADVNDIFRAVEIVHKRCKGAYAVIIMIAGYGILGFRDPYGIRPLVLGRRETDAGPEYMLASESVALSTQGFRLVCDIAPGQGAFIDVKSNLYTKQCAEKSVYSPCIFEFVYFARPDSIIDNISVHKARSRMGRRLAQKIKREWNKGDIDVVIPIPDTSRTAALKLADELGVSFAEGFIKNRYIGRTFIMPGQKVRQWSVHKKLNPIELEFQHKSVLLVDDSIVRGNTSRQIVQMARDAGASRVFFASASPPVRYQNVYGIDMPAASELIAYGRTQEEVCKFIGADKLIYQDLPALIEAIQKKGKSHVDRFEASVFDGVYVTGDVTLEYLTQLELQRNDLAKVEQNTADSILELHNTR